MRSAMDELIPCIRMGLIVLMSCVVLARGQDNQVAVKWGVADSTAIIGKLFRVHIPSDAFTGKVLSYKVQSSGESPLPKWLEFDAKNNVLQGIPSQKDGGQVYLEITAQGATNQATTTSTIFVRDVPSHASGAPLKFKSSGPDFVWCKEKEPETVATIIVDEDFEGMSVSDRIAMLANFLKHMGLHEEMVKMVPVGNQPMHDSSALVSGSGDSASPKTSGLFISWPVGCGQVRESHFPVLQKLDEDSASSRMSKVLGQPVIGWRVTNSHFQAPTRRRRQVHATPTPAVTPIMPTKTDTKQEKTDDADGKMTHKVVDTPSPTFIQPTATQPPATKTDEPAVIPPIPEPDKPDKVMPTETTPKVTPITKTKAMPDIKPTKTHHTTEPTDVPPGRDECMPGQKPEKKQPIGNLEYQFGRVIDFEIPENTFADCEVGGTRGLELVLFLDKTNAIPPNFFLQFDANNQKLFGLPMENDLGTHRFNLIGKKKSNSLAESVEFTVQINKGGRMKKRINHELSVTVDYDYKKFMASVDEKVGMAKRVASIYGDEDASYLLVTKMQEGSVVYSWTNSTMASTNCPAEDITKLVRKLVNEDGTLSDEAIEKMEPYVLLSAAAEPAGSCKDNPKFPTVVSKPRESTPPAVDKPDEMEEDDKATTKASTVEDKDGEIKIKEGERKPETTTHVDVARGGRVGDDDDDIWITTVVPAVVIVVILLIALLIACILYRKKRKGKMNVEEQNTFINKGAPVIFPDELEDKPSDVNKPLLVEGSPAPPPEYHRGASESPERILGPSHRNHGNQPYPRGADDSITEMPEKPYNPPPPVTTSSNNKQPRATHQQPYSQPPQILP